MVKFAFFSAVLRCLRSFVFQAFGFGFDPVLSVFIRGKVFPDGKENLLAALYRAGRCHGLGPAVLMVEPGAHLAAARPLLVGGLSQRMV